MKYLLSTAFLLVAIFSLTSCGKDEPKQKQTATATYNLSFSQDLLDACNVIRNLSPNHGGPSRLQAISSPPSSA